VWPWPENGEPGKAYITNPESCSIFRTLVFLKYGLTFREPVCELEHVRGATAEILATAGKDYRRSGDVAPTRAGNGDVKVEPFNAASMAGRRSIAIRHFKT
jgi:hypothetical protein